SRDKRADAQHGHRQIEEPRAESAPASIERDAPEKYHRGHERRLRGQNQDSEAAIELGEKQPSDQEQVENGAPRLEQAETRRGQQQESQQRDVNENVGSTHAT